MAGLCYPCVLRLTSVVISTVTDPLVHLLTTSFVCRENSGEFIVQHPHVFFALAKIAAFSYHSESLFLTQAVAKIMTVLFATRASSIHPSFERSLCLRSTLSTTVSRSGVLCGHSFPLSLPRRCFLTSNLSCSHRMRYSSYFEASPFPIVICSAAFSAELLQE